MSADDQGKGSCGYLWLSAVLGGIIGTAIVTVPVVGAAWRHLHPPELLSC